MHARVPLFQELTCMRVGGLACLANCSEQLQASKHLPACRQCACCHNRQHHLVGSGHVDAQAVLMLRLCSCTGAALGLGP